MKRERVALMTMILPLAACNVRDRETMVTATRPDDSPVEFAIELWPGEGIPVIEMQRMDLALLANPAPGAPVVDTLRGRIGRRIAFDSTEFQTIAVGVVRAITPLLVRGRDHGRIKFLSRDRYYARDTPEFADSVPAQSTVEVLQYRAEGTCFVRIRGHVIDAQPCPGFGRESVTVVRPEVTRWWIFTRGSRGAPGWILVSDSTARVVRREF